MPRPVARLTGEITAFVPGWPWQSAASRFRPNLVSPAPYARSAVTWPEVSTTGGPGGLADGRRADPPAHPHARADETSAATTAVALTFVVMPVGRPGGRPGSSDSPPSAWLGRSDCAGSPNGGAAGAEAADDCEGALQRKVGHGRRVADVDAELPDGDDPAVGCVAPVRQVVAAEAEMDGGGPARLQRDLLETLELARRLGRRGRGAQVQLRRGRPCYLACVGNRRGPWHHVTRPPVALADRRVRVSRLSR